MITKRKGGYLWGKFIYRMQNGRLWIVCGTNRISEIVIALSEKKAWDKHTVITLLNRMEKKGAVSFERNGRAKEYYPLISQKETVKQETEQFFERVCQGSLRLMVNSFLSSKAVKKEDLDELYRMLDEAREGKE